MYRALCGSFAATLLLSLPVQAATLAADSTTLAAVFAQAKAGDTIQLSGNFGATDLTNRTFSTALTIDASLATFSGTLAITNVKGLKVLGGNYGSSTTLLNQAVRVLTSDLVSFINPIVVGDGTQGHGIDFKSSSHVTVDGGVFTGLRSGVALIGVNGAALRNNQSIQAASDGFDIADSHQVKVTFNTCSNTQMSPGAHPDCVQLWSLAGRPRQSDILIADNIATGPTQGFTSFDAEAGGGLRIKILRNVVDTSWSQGIACFNCDYSTIQNNTLTTQAGALFQTQMKVYGTHTVISGNTIGAYNGRPGQTRITVNPGTGGEAVETPYFESYAEVFGDYDASIAAVAEPGVWAMLIAGFGLSGGALRRRRVAFA